MWTILQSSLDGLCSGAIYGLIAISLSLLFGVMKIINFAHGAFLMMAMYFTLWICTWLSIHPLLATVIVAAVMFPIGYYTQRVLIQEIYEKEKTREPIGVLIFTTGLWIFINNLFLLIAGPDFRVLNHEYLNQTLSIGEIMLSYSQIVGFFLGTFISIGFVIFLKKAKIGQAIRATGQDREAANVIGIDSYKIYNVSFGLGMTVLGIASGLLMPLYYVYPAVGDIFGLRSFVIVVLGGMGSIGGAFLGGLIIGLIESVGAQFVPTTFTEGIIFFLFLMILYLKPTGLFGLESE